MAEGARHRLRKIVSGGQTGVDRAALAVGQRAGIELGGWIPAGRWAEDGEVPASFDPLHETPLADPAQRTEWNVRDSDATLLISRGALSGGSQLTLERARHHEKPWLHLDLEKTAVDAAAVELAGWLDGERPRVLNVAGPRASEDAVIGLLAEEVLSRILPRPKVQWERLELTLDALDRVWEIDRSEVVEEVYELRGSELRRRRERHIVEGWEPAARAREHRLLERCLESGGVASVALLDTRIVGAAVLARQPVASRPGALQLSFLYVDRSVRGCGIGAELFDDATRRARAWEARSVYVSATPTCSTVDFYLRRGCRVTTPDPALLALEPDDIHLEKILRLEISRPRTS